MNKIHCAIYVRKSNEKGMDMEFNSLHNQEEACKNYILSQSFNGWEHYKTYTDGGISGGTMNRPALQEMLEDMKNGLIQIVTTYKIDRFSRSIVDFHKAMQIFEKHECSFVSITQSFDTSTSMGKLTLNMLLSFAQFEREVSSERIRDKITASKKKGIWTGGPPPLGYDVKDRKLVPNEEEVKLVNFIFETYLEVKSISKLREILKYSDIRSKQWTAADGQPRGGKVLSSSMTARILRAKVYIGKIEHKVEGQDYQGQHEAIINKYLFNKVQNLLNENKNKHNKVYNMKGFLLSRKIFDNNGNQFKNQKSSKNESKKYRYYALRGKYLPAGDVEEITIQLIKNLFNYGLDGLLTSSQTLEFKSIDFESLSTTKKIELIRAIISKIIHHNNKITYFIKINELSYMKPFKKDNYLNVINNEVLERIYVSEDKEHLIIEKDIHINNRPSTNQYVGQGKKIISIGENNNNLIKALSVAW